MRGKYRRCPDGCAAYIPTRSQRPTRFSATPPPPGGGYRVWNTGFKKAAGCLIAQAPRLVPQSQRQFKSRERFHPRPYFYSVMALSRSIVSLIARLMKAFRLSPCLAAWD